jgi:hypothetical protein
MFRSMIPIISIEGKAAGERHKNENSKAQEQTCGTKPEFIVEHAPVTNYFS